MLSNSGLLAWTSTGGCYGGMIRSLSAVPVRPGPWKSDTRYKNLGRVFGKSFINAKALNISIAEGAQVAMDQLQLCSTVVERDAVLMSYVRQIGLIVEEENERMTFVNVSTVVHRIGMVTAAAGLNDLVISQHKELICRYPK